MSTIDIKIPWLEAKQIALNFCQLIMACEDPTSLESWEGNSYIERIGIAGSIRRGRPLIGDVEIVVIPRRAEVAVQDGLFQKQKMTNLLFRRLDDLEAAGSIRKHWYGDSYRWGEKYRGCDFGIEHMRGASGPILNHEIFVAERRNWGSVLMLRTGSAEFNKRWVVALRQRNLRHEGGFVRYGLAEGQGEIIDTPDEETLFKLCGMDFIPPEERN